MTPFAGLGLSSPWALGLLSLLPVLWLLLRLAPPPPRLLRFPAMNLLRGLRDQSHSPARLPPWLLALRLTVAALLILAAAGPVLGGREMGSGTLVLVVDDGWASARDWASAHRRLMAETEAALRRGAAIRLLATAPPSDGGPVTLTPPISGNAALEMVRTLSPHPWPVDRAAARAALDPPPPERIARVLWLADGIEDGGSRSLAQALQSLGAGLDMIQGRPSRQLLAADIVNGEGLHLMVRRLPTQAPEPLSARALDQDGLILGKVEALAGPDETEIRLNLPLPLHLMARTARIELSGEGSASGVLLADPAWNSPEVGLTKPENSGPALLDPQHYLMRALGPTARVRTADPEALAQPDGPKVLLLADGPPPPPGLSARLLEHVRSGAMLVHFAGPTMAHGLSPSKPNPLLPVPLRAGGRALGGAMSWTRPQPLADFPPASPFHGLDLPSDVRVRSQVLAEPSALAGVQVWASLADGTPLVTADRRGKGWLVLFHTTADPQWTDLPLSGLFPAMLRRLIMVGPSGPALPAPGPLPPSLVMDGTGRLGPPGSAVQALPSGPVPPGPRHPPGLYGEGMTQSAVNLSPGLAPPQPLRLPPGARRLDVTEDEPGLSLRPHLLTAALTLLLIEGVATLAVMGALGRVLTVLLVLSAPAAHAAGAADGSGQVRLGCLSVGDRTAETDCLAGLEGLSRLLSRRTTVNPGPPVLVEAGRDALDLLPLIYWPLRTGQPPLSVPAAQALAGFMARGGLLILDTGEGDMGSDAQARALAPLAGLPLPPLVPLPEGHVLNRAFYLTRDAPGRWAGGSVWVAAEDAAGVRDGVSPVVLGSADWAAAWAIDRKGLPLHGVVPGGEVQREMAYRFGVNLVLYALTGNYKDDQVHLPAILERLSR